MRKPIYIMWVSIAATIGVIAILVTFMLLDPDKPNTDTAKPMQSVFFTF